MQAQFNDLYATSVDVTKRLTESNWHAWDRFMDWPWPEAPVHVPPIARRAHRGFTISRIADPDSCMLDLVPGVPRILDQIGEPALHRTGAIPVGKMANRIPSDKG